ncbi:MAG: 3-hydroxyisobutyryl-CoA hydrolase [Dongiaceae bacterium]
MTEGSELRVERRGRLCLVILDRPAALNALTLGMVDALDALLRAAASDSGVAAVAVRGAGERAFCAGGDIRALYEAGRRGEALSRDFYCREYRLNRRIARFPKPYIALIDGIVMGGGVGVSMLGSHRLVGDRALFAMPETGIGFFPDVGGGWFLPRCPGEIGAYLGLTGARLGPADMLAAGLATHGLSSAALAALPDELPAALERPDGLARLLADRAAPPAPAGLAGRRAAIDRLFAGSSVEAILARLAAAPEPWAAEAAEALRRASPTSLKVTLRHLRAGHPDLETVLRMEYRMTQHFMRGEDFFEGVRAAIIDKDKRPRWRPDRLEAVSEAAVAGYFAPLAGPDLDFPD